MRNQQYSFLVLSQGGAKEHLCQTAQSYKAISHIILSLCPSDRVAGGSTVANFVI